MRKHGRPTGGPKLSFVDGGETERALLRRLLGEIEAGAMETLPYFLPLGRIHPGRSRRCFLIGHVASPLHRAIRSSQLIDGSLQACSYVFFRGVTRLVSPCAHAASTARSVRLQSDVCARCASTGDQRVAHLYPSKLARFLHPTARLIPLE